jgi:hypothetical protein
MTRFNSNRSDATKQPCDIGDFDAYLIDDEFDNMFDREFFAIRDLADYCNS